jgi:hypothetical protein
MSKIVTETKIIIIIELRNAEKKMKILNEGQKKNNNRGVLLQSITKYII